MVKCSSVEAVTTNSIDAPYWPRLRIVGGHKSPGTANWCYTGEAFVQGVLRPGYSERRLQNRRVFYESAAQSLARTVASDTVTVVGSGGNRRLSAHAAVTKAAEPPSAPGSPAHRYSTPDRRVPTRRPAALAE